MRKQSLFTKESNPSETRGKDMNIMRTKQEIIERLDALKTVVEETKARRKNYTRERDIITARIDECFVVINHAEKLIYLAEKELKNEEQGGERG